jgi:DNA-binding IclR family transcriptional regulator
MIDAVVAAPEGLSLIDMSSSMKLPLSTTHRMAKSLIDVGYLTVDATKTYRVGERLKRVFLLNGGKATIQQVARPILVELAEHFRETAFVTRLAPMGIELVDFYFPMRGARTLVHPGNEFPMHAAAAGKAIFAYQPESVIEAEIGKGLKKYLPATITDPKKVRADLGRVRRRGYAINVAELDAGVLAIAAPVSIGDAGVVAAVAVVGPKERMLKHYKITAIGELLRESAAELSSLVLENAHPEAS